MIKPIRLCIQHVEIKLFKINIQRNNGAAFQAFKIKRLFKARIDTIQEADEGDLVHAESFRKPAELARVRLCMVCKDFFVIFGFERKVIVPELFLLVRCTLRIGGLSPLRIKAHMFLSPMIGRAANAARRNNFCFSYGNGFTAPRQDIP